MQQKQSLTNNLYPPCLNQPASQKIYNVPCRKCRKLSSLRPVKLHLKRLDKTCHPERSEGPRSSNAEVLRCAQDDSQVPTRQSKLDEPLRQTQANTISQVSNGNKVDVAIVANFQQINRLVMSHVAIVANFQQNNQTAMSNVAIVLTNSFFKIRLTHEMVLYQSIVGLQGCNSRRVTCSGDPLRSPGSTGHMYPDALNQPAMSQVSQVSNCHKLHVASVANSQQTNQLLMSHVANVANSQQIVWQGSFAPLPDSEKVAWNSPLLTYRQLLSVSARRREAPPRTHNNPGEERSDEHSAYISRTNIRK